MNFANMYSLGDEVYVNSFYKLGGLAVHEGTLSEMWARRGYDCMVTYNSKHPGRRCYYFKEILPWN